jgi:ABC-type sugar transport system substrate-binding protein
MNKDNQTETEPTETISRRKLLGGMAAGGAAVALGAVAGPAGAATRPASITRRIRSNSLQKSIGFSQPDTTASIWQPLMKGAQQEAHKLGYTLLESHANSQLSAQLSEIQTWIGEGVAGIIVLPLDNSAIQPLITKAHAKGIKMLDYSDSALPHTDGWVIFDNLQGAALVGKYAGQWINKTIPGGKAQVAMLTHNIQLTGRQRTQGCWNALKAVAPHATLVAQHEGVLSPDTLGPAQAMLQAHPNINVFICIADEGCDGVWSAFKGTHPSAARQKEMFICGFDGSGPVIQQVLAGTPVRATGALDAVAIGAASVSATAAAIRGNAKGARVKFPYVLVDYYTQAAGKKLLKDL